VGSRASAVCIPERQYWERRSNAAARQDSKREVTMLLEAWVIGEEARQSDHAAQIAQWVAASNAVLEQGSSPDEWSRF
jgi:hypothetical protein